MEDLRPLPLGVASPPPVVWDWKAVIFPELVALGLRGRFTPEEDDTGAPGRDDDGATGPSSRGIFDGGCPVVSPPTPFVLAYPPGIEDGGALGGITGSPISCLTRSASARFMASKIMSD